MPDQAPESLMLTVFLRHDQSQNLEQLQGKLDDADWWHGFPPEGCEIVSWVVAMGVGQAREGRRADRPGAAPTRDVQ